MSVGRGSACVGVCVGRGVYMSVLCGCWCWCWYVGVGVGVVVWVGVSMCVCGWVDACGYVWVRGCSCMGMGVRFPVRLCVLYIHLILTTAKIEY